MRVYSNAVELKVALGFTISE